MGDGSGSGFASHTGEGSRAGGRDGPGARALRGPSILHELSEVLRRPGWRRVALARRVTAGLLVVVALVLALAPAGDAAGVPVLVAARDLESGATLTAADLLLARWPADLVPAGTLAEPAAADGRVLAGAARAGEPVTDVRLAGPELAARLAGSPDAAAVPVRLAEPDVAGLLRSGSRVDVVTAGEDGGVVLAADVAIVTVLPAAAGGSAGPLVLVAMPRSLATHVAAASLADQVAVTLR